MWMISLATIWAHTASRKHLIVGKAHVNKQQNGKSHGIDIVAKPQTNLISFFACLFSGPTRSSWFFWLPLSLLPHQQGTADRDTLQLFLFIIKKKKNTESNGIYLLDVAIYVSIVSFREAERNNNNKMIFAMFTEMSQPTVEWTGWMSCSAWCRRTTISSGIRCNSAVYYIITERHISATYVRTCCVRNTHISHTLCVPLFTYLLNLMMELTIPKWAKTSFLFGSALHANK